MSEDGRSDAAMEYVWLARDDPQYEPSRIWGICRTREEAKALIENDEVVKKYYPKMAGRWNDREDESTYLDYLVERYELD